MLSRQSIQIAEFYEEDRPREVVLLDAEQDRLPYERIVCPELRLIGQAWADMQRETGDQLPKWRSFSPTAFKPMLPKICVLRVGDWRADEIEFTLYGSHPTDYIGGGRPLVMQQLRHDPDRCANYYDIRNRAGRAVDSSAPQYARKTMSWADMGFIEYEVLMLPFRAEKGVQRVLQPVSAHLQRCQPAPESC